MTKLLKPYPKFSPVFLHKTIMAYNSSAFAPLPPILPHHHSKSRKLLLYYGMAVVGTIAIILAVYNIMVLRWCAIISRHMPPQQANTNFEPSSTSRSFDDPNSQIALSSKYKKEQVLGQEQGHDHVCSVCLSHFEEGDEVRQLQKCKHYFHIPCIDTWLRSHLDCPVCRAPVRSPILWHHADQSDNSREVLLLGSMSV